MPLMLPDSWTWDFWLVADGDDFHLFFLRASRALLDPERRHRRAEVGHAVSTDLRSWTVLPDALARSDQPALDDLAVWTGSAIQLPRGGWRMFHTGISHAEGGSVQRISWADSTDLVTWHRSGRTVEADGRWYEKLGDADRIEGNDQAGEWHDENWRDPWVFADPAGDGWHMLVTARANTGELFDRGVVGHARSQDLENWTVQPPLSLPDAGFGQLEVMQVTEVDGRPVLIFSCRPAQTSPGRREASPGGVWSLPLDSPTGPFDLRRADRLTGPELYAGRVVRDAQGRSLLLSFVHDGPDGRFVGGLPDPVAVGWRDGSLQRI